jgi:hypothetical protein
LELNLFSVWAFYLPLFGTLVNLGLLYWKRHSHPWNFVLLATFTAMEGMLCIRLPSVKRLISCKTAFTLGVVVAFYNNVIVLQAL